MSEIPFQGLRKEIKSPDDSVFIRRLNLEDAQRYFELIEYDRAHLSQHGDATAEKYQTVEDVIKSLENPNPNKYRFGIWDGDVMVGTNNLTRLDDSTVESGSWVGKQYVGRHYAARGRARLLDFAFHDLHASRVISKIAIGNEASKKSIEQSGYSFVGTEADQWIYEISKEDYGSRTNC